MFKKIFMRSNFIILHICLDVSVGFTNCNEKYLTTVLFKFNVKFADIFIVCDQKEYFIVQQDWSGRNYVDRLGFTVTRVYMNSGIFEIRRPLPSKSFLLGRHDRTISRSKSLSSLFSIKLYYYRRKLRVKCSRKCRAKNIFVRTRGASISSYDVAPSAFA